MPALASPLIAISASTCLTNKIRKYHSSPATNLVRILQPSMLSSAFGGRGSNVEPTNSSASKTVSAAWNSLCILVDEGVEYGEA